MAVAPEGEGIANEALGPLISSHPPNQKALVGQNRVAKWVGLLGRFGILLAAVVAFRTGEILALVSRPAFDPNRFAAGIDPDRRRRPSLDGSALSPRATD